MMTAVIQSSAPGKVILHGEHAVVFNKNAIAMSVGLRTHVQVTRDPKAQQVRISYQNLVSESIWSLDELKQINFGK
jgi:mevalonate kinase